MNSSSKQRSGNQKKSCSNGSAAEPLKAVVTKAKSTPEPVDPSERSLDFPIVGIGSSAGGLEALEQFIGNVPKDCGLAFVVVQHLDPDHKDIMVELLQRHTGMPILQVLDQAVVQRNHVYIIPPNKDLSVLHGVLHLLEPAAARGLRLPIDFFFRSLAADRSGQSIGVILSGMGSDGTLGLRAIKEQAGAVFVQSLDSAKFDSMPRSAIDAGLADIVAPAEELPGKILNYLKHLPRPESANHNFTERDQGALEKIMILLRGHSGHDFSLYKKGTIRRRVERRMGLHQIPKIADYVRYLRDNPQESELLFKELLIGVTSFFRDPMVWEELKEKVIPELLMSRPQGGSLRAWTVGCSTGEEAYSLAMVFKEALEKTSPQIYFTLQIFATDLDKDAIDRARTGVYPDNISSDVSERRLEQFFIKNEQSGYALKKEIREMVTFAPQNLVMHPPFTRLDFVTCRNLLIYLDAALQKKLMPLFHYSLTSGGILLLGSAETVGTATDLFSSLGGKSRLYRRIDTAPHIHQIEFPSAFSSPGSNKNTDSSARLGEPSTTQNLQTLADQLLLQHFSPAAVLVTKEGDILYVSGKTGKYLEPAAGKANWNLFAMSREGLGNALNEAFHKAVRKKAMVKLEKIKVGTGGSALLVDIIVQPVTSPEPLRGMVMVVFSDVIVKKAGKSPHLSQRSTDHNHRLDEMAQELKEAHEELQVARDDMQASQEELRSTNEELQSMNEELQSTNEELTTSKEEMQSMNEELQTVNHELQAKVDQLSYTSTDMKNLLDSTDIATLFLDHDLHVRRFTTKTASIINLIPGDVGRPITDIVTSLEYPGLLDDLKGVLTTQLAVEKQVSARDGRWFGVRIMPYKTQDNRNDGLVLTFADITVAKNLEANLRDAQTELEKRFSTQTVELGKARNGTQNRLKRPGAPSEKVDPKPTLRKGR